MERTSCTIPSTHATGDATLNGLLANADNLRFYALAVQRFGHLTQSRERVAIITWTSVDQKNFHKQSHFGHKYNKKSLNITISAKNLSVFRCYEKNE